MNSTVTPFGARYDRPWSFLALSALIPWSFWAAAIRTAHHGHPALTSVLGLAGLTAPLVVVAWMSRHDAAMRRDIRRRLSVRAGERSWACAALACIPAAVLVATAVSVVFGYSPEQFLLRGGVTFVTGALPGWVVLVLAPVLEEIAWHSYGTDALHTRFSVFTTSMVFVVYWALWHAPLALLPGTAQEQTVEQGWLHALNFPVSMIPFLLLINWFYYRSGRNITVTILFHLGANLVTQVFATHPDTEVMTTGLLLLAAAVLLVRDRTLFFAGPAAHDASPCRHEALR